MMYVKINTKLNSQTVGICDEDLLGKILNEGNKELDVNTHFFGGKKVPLSNLKDIFNHYYNIHSNGSLLYEFGQ